MPPSQPDPALPDPASTGDSRAAPTSPSSRAALLRAAVSEVVQPIRDFAKVPKALMWGVNVPYFLEGMVYFGILTELTKFLSENVGFGDAHASPLVGAFTGGITLAMFMLGELSDRWGVRRSLLFALSFVLCGRTLLALGETLGFAPGPWGPLCRTTLLGLLLVVVGYGAYQPAAYAAVKQYTDAKTTAMGYAMLYALQNFGSFVSGLFAARVRLWSAPALPPNGITGVLWVYSGLTLLGLAVTFLALRPRLTITAENKAIAISLGAVARTVSGEALAKPRLFSARWFTEHPLWDLKFSFFIFILIPVQTLFAHNWLTLPLYIERAFRDTPWVSHNFEFFANLNPLLIFVMTPLVTALTTRVPVYTAMLIGTAGMALPTFLLTLGPSPKLLLTFTLLSSIGESLWQPRFLQYVAEIAPPGKTGMYMGVAQFPWFLTKLLTSLYSGWFLSQYCPSQGAQRTEMMWFIYSVIACGTPVGLLLASGWVGKDISRRSMQARVHEVK